MTSISNGRIAAAFTLVLGMGLSACAPTTGDSQNVRAVGYDTGIDRGSLSQLEAGIYIDPDGCHIWMVDDGLEGYWSRRLDPRSGLPVCTGVAPPNSIVGDISRTPGLPDFTPGF